MSGLENHTKGEAAPTQEGTYQEHGRECCCDVGEGIVERDILDGKKRRQQEDGDHLHDEGYGMFLHESQYLEPVMPDIEAMLTSSQRNVTGTAILKLRHYGFETVGIDSANDLTKSKLGEYGETQTGWTADEAKGFIKVSSTPLRVYYGIHPNER